MGTLTSFDNNSAISFPRGSSHASKRSVMLESPRIRERICRMLRNDGFPAKLHIGVHLAHSVSSPGFLDHSRRADYSVGIRRSGVRLTLCCGPQWLILRASDQKPQDDSRLANCLFAYRNRLAAARRSPTLPFSIFLFSISGFPPGSWRNPQPLAILSASLAP